jgi:hypothetical protein
MLSSLRKEKMMSAKHLDKNDTYDKIEESRYKQSEIYNNN